MAMAGRGVALESLGRLFGRGTVTALGEGALLERFAAEGDEAAFEALVTRHGPMVLGVCRRGLVDPHDVEDAFQATFLVLVRKAGSLRDADHLGPWLFGVARKVTGRARVRSARRRDRERPGSEHAALAVNKPESHDLDRRELRSVLDEEIGRLPEKYRAPVVLCYLEGLTHEEAAGQLRCPVGTVRSRLSWARERLRVRLDRRGLAPTGLVVGPVLTSPFSPPVPPALTVSTLSAVARASVGTLSTTTAAGAAVLAKGVTTAMFLKKLSLAASTLAVTALLAGGAALSGAVPGDQPGADAQSGPRDGAAPDFAKSSIKRRVSDPPDAFKSSIKPPDERPREAVQELPDSAPATAAQVRLLLNQNRELQNDLVAIKTQMNDLQHQLQQLTRLSRMMPSNGPVQATPPVAPLAPVAALSATPPNLPVRPLPPQQNAQLHVAAGAISDDEVRPLPPQENAQPPALPHDLAFPLVAPAKPTIPTILESGGLVAVVSPEGDRILARTKLLLGMGGGMGGMGGIAPPPVKSGFQLFRVPRGVKVSPIVNNNLLALLLEGPNISEIAVFDASSGGWAVRTVDPPASGRVSPTLYPELITYVIGNRVYAYSSRARRWDRADFKNKPTFVSQTGFGTGFKDDSTLYAFDMMTGTFKKVDFESLAAEAEHPTTILPAEEKPQTR